MAVNGSGGAGQYRGGMAIRRVYRADHDCHVRVDGARILSRPWGLNGGRAGGYASITSSANLRQGSAMLRRGDQIAVVSGVNPGEEVVTSGVFKLRNGAAVQINNSVKPGNTPAARPENS